MSKSHNNITLEINNLHENTQSGNDRNRKNVARRRWGILAKALKSPISSQPSSPTDEISMRRFSTFMLLTTEKIHCQNEKHYTNEDVYNNKMNHEEVCRRKQHVYSKKSWYRYSACIGQKTFFVDIAHTARSFTAVDLMGFNNTGNVCVWPSEEALAFYALHHLDYFTNKSILELGAGMSALAGLLIAKYASSKRVHLTDGNSLAVENIKLSLERNHIDSFVTSNVLQWGSTGDEECMYDVILSADCLFFDEARNDLIDTIWKCLNVTGIAYVMAPKRGETLNIFVDHAEMRGFVCNKIQVYDQQIWNRHLECLLENRDYQEDIHYPILILMSKSS